jgi:hypothetical protein
VPIRLQKLLKYFKGTNDKVRWWGITADSAGAMNMGLLLRAQTEFGGLVCTPGALWRAPPLNPSPCLLCTGGVDRHHHPHTG